MEIDEIFYGVISKHRNEKKYLESIDRVFSLFRIKREDNIIDVAGGLGFPYLDLERRGFNITYSDGSKNAVSKVSYKALIPANCHHLFWHDLKRYFGTGKFSYVFCVGQSLPYALSWNDLVGNSAKRYLFRTLINFSKILEQGGILHVDYSPEPREDYTLFNSQDLVLLGGVEKNIRTSVILENDRRRLKFSASDSEIEKEGFNVTRNLIVSLAKRVGLELVLEERLQGDIFNSIFLRKNE